MPSSLRPPKQPQSWDARFLKFAQMVAGWSKDPSTKVGACCVRNRRVLSTGYNGLPSGVLDSDYRLTDPEMRRVMTTHAEVNLVAMAAQNGVSMMGSTVYVWPLMSNAASAACLIQAGVSRVVIPDDVVMPARRQEDFDIASSMFSEAGVALVRLVWSDPPVDEAASPP